VQPEAARCFPLDAKTRGTESAAESQDQSHASGLPEVHLGLIDVGTLEPVKRLPEFVDRDHRGINPDHSNGRKFRRQFFGRLFASVQIRNEVP